MRHLALAAAVVVMAALAACGPDRSATTPAAGKDTSPAPTASTPAATPKAEPVAATPAPAAPNPAAAPKPAEPAIPTAQPVEAAAKVVNTICPVTGLAVDPTIPPVEVTIDIVHPPMIVLIGVSNAEAAKRVAADPERFAAAARNNREARDPRNPASGAGQR